MKVVVDWDEVEQVATVVHDEMTISNLADVLEWKAQLLPQLARIHERIGRRFPIAVCFDGVLIAPAASASYGKVVRDDISGYASLTARYGQAAMVRAVAATEAVRQGYRVNLFDTRQQALDFIRKTRRDA